MRDRTRVGPRPFCGKGGCRHAARRALRLACAARADAAELEEDHASKRRRRIRCRRRHAAGTRPAGGVEAVVAGHAGALDAASGGQRGSDAAGEAIPKRRARRTSAAHPPDDPTCTRRPCQRPGAGWCPHQDAPARSRRSPSDLRRAAHPPRRQREVVAGLGCKPRQRVDSTSQSHQCLAVQARRATRASKTSCAACTPPTNTKRRGAALPRSPARTCHCARALSLRARGTHSGAPIPTAPVKTPKPTDLAVTGLRRRHVLTYAGSCQARPGDRGN